MKGDVCTTALNATKFVAGLAMIEMSSDLQVRMFFVSSLFIVCIQAVNVFGEGGVEIMRISRPNVRFT